MTLASYKAYKAADKKLRDRVAMLEEHLVTILGPLTPIMDWDEDDGSPAVEAYRLCAERFDGIANRFEAEDPSCPMRSMRHTANRFLLRSAAVERAILDVFGGWEALVNRALKRKPSEPVVIALCTECGDHIIGGHVWLGLAGEIRCAECMP